MLLLFCTLLASLLSDTIRACFYFSVDACALVSTRCIVSVHIVRRLLHAFGHQVGGVRICFASLIAPLVFWSHALLAAE